MWRDLYGVNPSKQASGDQILLWFVLDIVSFFGGDRVVSRNVRSLSARTSLLTAMSAAALHLSAWSVAAQTPASAAAWDDPANAARVQQALDQALATSLTPGAIVSIRQGDARQIFSSGAADVALQTPPTSDTYFGYRSVTKSFVTTVILQLASEGRIGLDDPVSKYVAGAPGGDIITVRQLAEMRSGLLNYTSSQSFIQEFPQDPGRAWEARELLAFAFSEPLQFTPGSQYQYSNTNTVLLGEIITAVTGKSWSAEVNSRLATRLGLASVTDQGAGPMRLPNAVGYADDGSGPFALDMFNATGLAASGALSGVIGDLERWGKAAGTGELLSKREFVARLKSFGSTASDPRSPEYDSYGFGMGEISGWIGHTGNGLGFEALVMYDRANDRTISVLFNASNEDGDAPAHLFRQLLAILRWTEPANQRQVVADGAHVAISPDETWTGLVSGPFGARAAVYVTGGGVATATGPVNLAPMQDYVPAIHVANGLAELGMGGVITASEGGDGAFLMSPSGKASLILTGVDIHMRGDDVSGVGVDARDNSVATLEGVSISGPALAALHAGGGAPAAITGKRLGIALTEGDGAWASANGAITLSDSRISLTGPGYGLVAASLALPATIRGDGLSVETMQAGSHGVLAQGAGASVVLGDTSILTHGPGGHGIALGMGASVTLRNSNVRALGAEAAAVAAFPLDPVLSPRHATLTLANSTLSSASGVAIVAAGTRFTLAASGASIIGAITHSPDAEIHLGLDGGSVWTLAASGVATASQLTGLTSQNSTIAFAAPSSGAAPFSTLTVGNYHGAGSVLVMNAAPGAGRSAADRLVLNGGAATGSTRIMVQPLGGGATSGDGVLLVETRNGGRTDEGAFALGGRVAAGAYNYNLYRGGAFSPDDWFLRSTRPDASGGGGVLPDFRVETSLNLAVPAMASQYGLAMLGSHAERTRMRATDADGRGAWARVFGETGRRGGAGGSELSRASQFFRNGSSYDVNFSGFQTGFDLPLGQTGGVVGLYAGAGQTEGQVAAVYGGRAGSVSMDAYTLGGYWTLSDASGWYLDAILQGTFYSDVKTRSILGQTAKTSGSGLLASIEGGYRFALAQDWAIEPRAQLVYQRLSFGDAADQYGQVRYGASNAAHARLGLRIVHNLTMSNGGAVSLWASSDLWHDFSNGADVVFSAPGGASPLRLASDPGGSRVAFGAGASAKFINNISLFASADYGVRVSGPKGHDIGGRVGLRIGW